MARDHVGPDRDRLLVAQIFGAAIRHARWGGLSEARKAAGAAELREVADGRGDLLAEVAGLALGTAEDKGAEYKARGEAVAELCRAAGADEALIPRWTDIGRERAGQASTSPCSERSQHPYPAAGAGVLARHRGHLAPGMAPKARSISSNYSLELEPRYGIEP